MAAFRVAASPGLQRKLRLQKMATGVGSTANPAHDFGMMRNYWLMDFVLGLPAYFRTRPILRKHEISEGGRDSSSKRKKLSGWERSV